MEKNEILEKYKKEEDRLLVSKLFDKISAVEKQNRIQYTDFLSPSGNSLPNMVGKPVAFSQHVT